MMGDVDSACDELALQISLWIAPYQPDMPPIYPNPLPTAGQIPATLCAAGYPIQPHVMKRLENHLAQIAIFDLKPGAVFPFYHRFAPVSSMTGDPGVGTETFEVAREKKQVAVQIWAATRDERQAISSLAVRQTMRDAYRLHQSDGSLTLFKYVKLESQDYEQVDSVYVRTFLYEADITELGQPVPAAEVVETIPDFAVGTPTPHTLNVNTL